MNNTIDNTLVEENKDSLEKTKEQKNTQQKIYAQIPLFKVFFMTVVTLGLYGLTWLYRNWRIYCLRNNTSVRTWIRTLFFPVTSFTLFKDMFQSNITAILMLFMQWIPLAITYQIHKSGYLTLIVQAIIFSFMQNKLNLPHNKAQESKKHYKFNLPCIIISAISISCFLLVQFNMV